MVERREVLVPGREAHGEQLPEVRVLLVDLVHEPALDGLPAGQAPLQVPQPGVPPPPVVHHLHHGLPALLPQLRHQVPLQGAVGGLGLGLEVLPAVRGGQEDGGHVQHPGQGGGVGELVQEPAHG